MPSVDRVGRYFPLTVVRPRGATEDQVPAAWLRALESLAVAACTTTGAPSASMPSSNDR
jgi:hypothetical protein